jgi:hypothetical protein
MFDISCDGLKARPSTNEAEHGSGSIDASEAMVPRTAISLGEGAGEEKLPRGVPKFGEGLTAI